MRLLNDPGPWWGLLRGHPLSVAELIDNRTLTAEEASIAAWTIEHGASVFVAAGPSGAGKSTLATALLEFLPENAALYVTSGAGDRMDVPDSDGPVYVLINELSYHMPVYLSGRAAQRAFNLLAQGVRIVGTLHARSASEAVQVMCAEADISRSALATGFLIAVVVAGRSGGRIVRQVAELGFLPPSGEITTLADLGLNGPHLQRSGLECLATWSGVPVERMELEIAARAARFPNQ
jgi:type IV secretory pathway ATPase VirB11/archaellum biosynthesis ATPase